MTINNSKGMMECIICWEEFEELNKCKKCNVNIHCNKCYDKMITKTCPICRKPLIEIQFGDFKFLKNNDVKDAIEGTFLAIVSLDAWDDINTREDEILMKTEALGIGHSGASWAISMGHCKKIAEVGWDNYVTWVQTY